MTREELNAVRGYVTNIQALKDAHIKDKLPINYGTICTITANGWKLIEELKALEPQPKTWSLDDAREDFMHDVYNTLDFLPTNNEANRIIDSFDRVTSGLKQQTCEDCISRQAALDIYDDYNVAVENGELEAYRKYRKRLLKLPPVQPKQKVGRWVEYTRVLIPEPINRWEQAWYCSECGYGNQECEDGSAWLEWKYCPNCGARMVEPQESEG